MKRYLVVLMLLCLADINIFADNSDFSTTRKDFRDESIYFLMTSRFYDGDPTNNTLCWDYQTDQISQKDPFWRGDFAGVIDKLDYIKALGFTAIWITPVVQNASGVDYHGYHAMDFSKVDIRLESVKGKGKYGGATRDVDFQTLINAAHAKGIKVILDIVLNHTGNFGEKYLCHEFDRSDNILNQADIDQSIKPTALLPSNYQDLDGSSQYKARLALMKNVDGQNHDTNNYWHHVASSWNWDEPSRWWGQIAGDCVDLNTENADVDKYLVDCYGKFIEMGVDGFRIDTSGHISRLSYNSYFIPKFLELGEKYKSKRLLAGQAEPSPFYMFGEVCARYSEVKYRNHSNLSPYYYTWKSDESLVSEWTKESTSWSGVEVKEGAEPLKNMLTCLNEADVDQTSNNTFMVDKKYHTPDYSKSSGFNVIDFPLHYNFSTAQNAYKLAKGGDNLYNDATYNVVYVDSHDYGPQPNDQVRFSGSDDQWAENFNLMFTFRGVPCVYYGSEIGFRRGVKIDNGGQGGLQNTGRAYFGGYITGDVTATDYGQYTASGNVQNTLSQPLSRHLETLNRARQAVPALRRGQWTSDGCSGSGISFMRDCGDEHPACVVIGGSATFSTAYSGTWTNILTGDTKSGSSFTANATGQGNLAIYVLNYTGKTGAELTGGNDKWIYGNANTEGSLDGDEEAGTDKYITPEDADGHEEEQLDPYTPSCGKDELCVFYETDASKVSIWVWNNSANFTGGSWSTKPSMEKMGRTDAGRKIYKWTYSGTETSMPTGVIFVKNGSQSADLEYKNHGYYIDNVWNHEVQPSTGIRELRNSGIRETGNTETFSLSGQRVGKGYKGIVITNGRKTLNP